MKTIDVIDQEWRIIKNNFIQRLFRNWLKIEVKITVYKIPVSLNDIFISDFGDKWKVTRVISIGKKYSIFNIQNVSELYKLKLNKLTKA